MINIMILASSTHADILSTGRGFVVVVVSLSEWWSVPTTVGTSLFGINLLYIEITLVELANF